MAYGITLATLQVMEMLRRRRGLTWPSTVKKIKKECLKQGSKVALESLPSVAVDLTGVSAAGQLP